MTDLRLARPWHEVREELDADNMSDETMETRSPRDFFAVDESSPYVVRVRESNGKCAYTRTPAPARSASVEAYENELR